MDGLKQIVDVVKQMAPKDIWKRTAATGVQVGHGVASAFESTTQAIPDWWSR
jgi:hypothetical protein